MENVTIAWFAVAIPLLYYVWQTWGLLGLRVEVGTNDSTFAVKTFIGLVNSAEQTMLIYDDGNDMDRSIYNDQRVIDAVRQQLDDKPDLRLFCVFSCEDDTKFTRQFSEHPQVKMKRGVQPRRAIHFKIIDGGQKGYVSTHPFGGEERRYRLYDCTRVPAHVRDAALGRHMRHMHDLFPDAEVAVA